MIRADLADQTLTDVSKKEFAPVSASERYKRHGHNPALIVVESNPALAARLERGLFDGHFEVFHVSDEALPISVLESQYPALESAGLVVIYSCSTLAPEAKRKIRALAADRYFDVSTLQLPAEDIDAVRKVLTLLQPLRDVVGGGSQGKIS
jgi:hypothetical protein